MIDVIRKQAYVLAQHFNRDAAREYAYLVRHEFDSESRIQELQGARLTQLLQHAYDHVAYYRRMFEAIGAVSSARVQTDRFVGIPILTRELVRQHFEELKSDDLPQRRWYLNKTGGSTGDPLAVIQERRDGRITGSSTLRLFYSWHGVHPGDREVKLWGSDRDLFYGAPPLGARVRRYCSGVRVLNAFRMTPNRMRLYVKEINTFRPKLLRGYCSNLYELACFAEENKLSISPPGVLISSAGKLYPHMRAKMEAIYGCRVFDHYGSREVHNVAMECEFASGLHVSDLTHFVEVVDNQGQPCGAGVEGRILVTSLSNYAMPLIRYDTGDRGAPAGGKCSCGRSLSRLASITGRSVDCFRTRSGQVVPGEFFIHLFGVVLKEAPFKKVQAIQEDFELVRFVIVLKERRKLEAQVCEEVVEKTRIVMGSDCQVEFEVVDDIPLPSSGKYRYTICNLTRSAAPLPRSLDCVRIAPPN